MTPTTPHTPTLPLNFPPLAHLSWYRLHLRYQFQAPTVMPREKSSSFRGALGHLLRAFDRELYDAVFERPIPDHHPRARKYRLAPSPYIVNVHDRRTQVYAAGDEISMHLTLIGQAAEHFPALLELLRDWRGMGFGKQGAPLELLDFHMYPPGNAHRWMDNLAAAGEAGIAVGAQLRTQRPILIRPGRKTEGGLDLPVITWHLLERINLLSFVYAGTDWIDDYRPWLEAAQTATMTESHFRLVDVPRYSGRQKRRLPLRGWVGKACWENIPASLIPLLLTGSQVHIGKGCPWGMGRYRMEVRKEEE